MNASLIKGTISEEKQVFTDVTEACCNDFWKVVVHAIAFERTAKIVMSDYGSNYKYGMWRGKTPVFINGIF